MTRVATDAAFSADLSISSALYTKVDPAVPTPHADLACWRLTVPRPMQETQQHPGPRRPPQARLVEVQRPTAHLVSRLAGSTPESMQLPTLDNIGNPGYVGGFLVIVKQHTEFVELPSTVENVGDNKNLKHTRYWVSYQYFQPTLWRPILCTCTCVQSSAPVGPYRNL